MTVAADDLDQHAVARLRRARERGLQDPGGLAIVEAPGQLARLAVRELARGAAATLAVAVPGDATTAVDADAQGASRARAPRSAEILTGVRAIIGAVNHRADEAARRVG